ncbi:MAG: RloB family protein [candidate division Zixibacteria bacterium]
MKNEGSRRAQREKDRLRSRADFVRKPGKKKQRQTILIVCHGQTEETYFKYLKEKLDLYRMGIVVKVVAKGEMAINVVQRALSEREKLAKSFYTPYNSVWCVTDVEITPKDHSIPRAASLAKKNKINFILSNSCFEYWFILHFEETASGFNYNKQVISRLKTHHAGYTKKGNIEKVVKEICKCIYDKTDFAIKNARKCRKAHKWGKDLTDHNPSTDVDKVVKKLIAISKM